MVAPAREREGVLVELEEVGHATHLVQLSRALEVIRHRDGVHGLGAVEHLVHGVEDGAVGVEVEVLFVQIDEALLEDVLREQHGREDRLLGGSVLRHRHIGAGHRGIVVVRCVGHGFS